MAAVSGNNNVQVVLLRSDAKDPYQLALITFNVTGTYAQADNGILTDARSLIANARKNGKIPSLKFAMCGQPARKESNPDLFMAVKTVAISTNDITFEITEGATAKTVDYSTELAAGAMPAQATPFGLVVGFEEA